MLHQEMTKKFDQFPNTVEDKKLISNYLLNRIEPLIHFDDISILESWRLFIDGIKQKADSGWIGFEVRESSYLFNICKSMAYALNHLENDLNPEFIQMLHKLAMNDVSNTLYHRDTVKEKPGEIRSCYVSYGLSTNIATKSGIKEIMKRMINQDFLTLKIVDTSEELSSIISQTGPFVEATEEQLTLCADSIYNFIAKGNLLKICGEFKEINNQSPAQLINNQLISFIQTYKSSIADAKDDSEKKIRAILTFLQDCEHMHVFVDGNGRVFYMVLLYFLFAKNGLPLPLMENINHIAGYSLDELIIKIKEGWENKKTLLTRGSLFEISTIDLLSTMNDKNREYYISSLKPLMPYFNSSLIFNFIDAFTSKDNVKVNHLVEKNPDLLEIAYKFFLHAVRNDTIIYLDEFQKDFLELFEKLIHYKDKYSANALLWAAFGGHYLTAEKLLQKGADDKIKDVWGYGLWENLREGLRASLREDKYTDIIRMLESNDPLSDMLSLDKNWRQMVIEEYFFEQIKLRNNQKIIQMNIRLPDLFKKLINGVDIDGNTPLMYAAKNNKDLLIFLLEMKVDNQVINTKGETALAIAEQCENNTECIELLRACENNPNSNLKTFGIFSSDKSQKWCVELQSPEVTATSITNTRI